ncbi:hypothetical protein TSUD_402450 [Trifolium subterraneum]|uniref:Transposase (putative) gypsy type domain-containing protein n=1 Tax=Trifolium subterraneum TaxID=3900 RepID=A0A2Z6PA27_TRISU|nr:hypothetical protein TSUD_402450 [Trifolium subterraneum]
MGPLRELDGAKDYPLVIHLVGTDWERQVRAHYTRADGTLNIDDIFNFTLVMGPLRELAGAKDYPLVIHLVGTDWERQVRAHYTWADGTLNIDDSVATISTSMEISSRFTTDEFVSTFRQAVRVSGEGGENRVVIDPVALREFVTTVNEQEPHYFYIYTHVLQTLHLWLLFNSFECQILRVMNVAPCQLHPNSWAFLKAFQVACEGLDLVPTAGVFFCFFHVKNVSPHSLISISSQPNKGRFSLYASNFKNYRDTFVRFRCREGFPELMFDVLSSVELISREDKPQSLGEYMGSMSTISAQQSGVKNTKRKNPEESGRISVEILKKRKNDVVDEEEAGIEDEPLKFRRMSKGRGLTSVVPARAAQMPLTRENELPPSAVPPTLRRGRERKATSPPICSLRILILLGALLTYYLSNRQELESIDFRNKMKSADNSLSALEKEFAAAKSKFEEDLAAVKAEQDQKVKAVVKAKDDEVIALKGKVKALEGELAVAIQGKEEASQKVDTLTAKVDALEMDVAAQYDDGFRFALDQVKVAFPDVDAVKLGELDSVNQIVDGKIVAYVPPASE